MRQLTPAEFATEIERDPAWARRLTEVVEITGYCDMQSTAITHLSPLLHFLGGNEGHAASFRRCPNLKVAEGTFAGWVNFAYSGVEKIGELTVTRTDTGGNAANFIGCTNLKVAEGHFPGHVTFANSGIEKVGKLHIDSPNKNGWAAAFRECRNLKTVPAKYLKPEYGMEGTIRDASLIRLAVVKAQSNAPNLEI